ncbi:LysR substrate-binding domain-containing protein [Actinokineospora auranticolor]|uniref:DNA-binding transcriptional LysR family regulator n=1 Tax=Actinokineospora auranticolor TaxID=155976 RepID=A0A2S6GCG4_9PSEU|nr:LysR family transcriptional regulator [Actinokineospora auranticolor]PPK62405.1 DNA-binding transcriptional LysR family regulator [Actinokineospora auranticolor]
MFDLVRLRILRTVADQGTLAAAADTLRLTPSAVSQQMAKLEREARCPLVERHGRRIRLTEEGIVLAQHAARILSAVEEAEVDLERRRGEVRGDFTVAAFPTAARGLLPRVLTALAKEHPDLHVRLREAEPYDAVAGVARGDHDLAMSQDWTNAPLELSERLHSTEIGIDHINVALPAAHPLADQQRVRAVDLVDEPWIGGTAGTSCHNWLVSTFSAAERQPDVVHQAGEFPTQLALVAAGLGVALLPKLAGDQVPEGVVLRPVEPKMVRRVLAVRRVESTGRPAMRAFLQALRDHWRG